MESSSGKRRTLSTTNTRRILPPISVPDTSKAKIKKQLFKNSTLVLISKKKTGSPRTRIVTEAVGLINGYHNKRQYPLEVTCVQSKLRADIDEILVLFKEINMLREKYGVIGLREEGQDDSFYLQAREITYNADLHDLNEKICSLKRTIQQKIGKVINIAKYFPRLRGLISGLLQQQSLRSVGENARAGKVAAMKAQRRLIEANRREMERIG